ncbi:MAG TPA: DNA primase, partial [Deltaproteobacteria bacterium]|nr:DNA primase [Deltaproteobacteria bacterium]
MDRNDVETIKAQIDIVSVISEYVALKQRGKSFIGLCPFHKEKTPSFNVDPQRQIYKCFGCGKGGDVINFVMEKKGLNFPEAVEELAARFHIPIKKTTGRKGTQNKQFFETNRSAMEYYEQVLNSPKGERARAYLKSRGLSDETIRTFRIGYAPDSWDMLSRMFREKGISLEVAFTCGLLIKRPSGGYYDRFRDRVMFPILDLSSEVIGFGGRAIGKADAKYINTPESPVFKKRRVLYNLCSAKAGIRDCGATVVEGYMDVVSLSNAGYPSAVATLGTAMGEEHVHLLRRFTDTIILVFDGDSAGKNAMLRAAEPFLNNDVNPKVVVLPAGKDPDDIARTDPDLWGGLLVEARSLWDFIFDESFSRRDPSKLEDQNTIIKELIPMISRMKDQVMKDLLAQRLSVRLGLPSDVIFHQLRPQSLSLLPEQERPDRSTGGLEDIMIRLMLFDDDAVRFAGKLGIADVFENGELCELASYLISRGAAALDDMECPDRIRVQAERIKASGEFPGEKKKALIDTLSRFKTLSIESDIRQIDKELMQIEDKDDKARRNEL